jgi:hypothetical protein
LQQLLLQCGGAANGSKDRFRVAFVGSERQEETFEHSPPTQGRCRVPKKMAADEVAQERDAFRIIDVQQTRDTDEEPCLIGRSRRQQPGLVLQPCP